MSILASTSTTGMASVATALFLNNVILGVVGGWSVRDTKGFGVARGSPGVGRALFNVDYIASDELGDLARLGIVLQMDFTLDDVEDGWARVVHGNRLANANLCESRRQVVRFIGREAIVEPMNLEVLVVVVLTALEPSLRNFNVLVRHFVDRG